MMDNTRLKTAGISGFLATSIGYNGVFITSGVITLVNAIIVAKGDFKYVEGAV